MKKLILIAVLSFSLSANALTVSTSAVSAATDKWSRMDLPTTLNYQMLPDSAIWDLTGADDGTLFALVEDTTGSTDVGPGAMVWDGLRWAVYPAYSDIAVFKSTDGGYDWSLIWHVPSSETGAPIAVVPQPDYVDGNSAKSAVFVAMGSRYISGPSSLATSYSGGLSQGNIYRSMNGGATFTRVTPRCPAVTLSPRGANTGGTITALDVIENQGNPGTYMAIVGISSLHTSDGTPTGNCGEGVYTWNQNNTASWTDLQISDEMTGSGTMSAGNGLDIIQIMGSRNFTTDGLICVVANDFIGTDPAAEPAGVYVCFYDSNDGIWGGDTNSPTNATRNAVSPLWTSEYAGAAAMDTGTDFNNVTSCYVFVGLDGCSLASNNDVWRVRGLSTVTGPSLVASCSVQSTGATRISDITIPGVANDVVYIGGEFPSDQAQVFKIANPTVSPVATPSAKPPSGAWPIFVANMAGTLIAAGGGDGVTTSGVHEMTVTSRGPVYNGVGLLDDIAISEDIPGYSSTHYGSWCLAEAVSQEVSPTYANDGLIYVGTYSDWGYDQGASNGSLSLWRLTYGKWERVMYEYIKLPDGFDFKGKSILNNVGDNTFVDDRTWWPRVVPQFSTDQSMFLLGGRNVWANNDYREMIWYSPDKGNDWRRLAQMPIGAVGWTPSPAGLSESGWWVQDSNTVFVGDMDGWIYKTTNRGASWTDGALTGHGFEIDSIQTSPIYSESGAVGTDKCLIVGAYDRNNHEDKVWLSQDGAIGDLENIGDSIYVNPTWTSNNLGGTIVNFDKNWATNKIIYAASGGWLDRWQLINDGTGELNRIDSTDAAVCRTIINPADPSASIWERLWDANDWNNVSPQPQMSSGMAVGSTTCRTVSPSSIQIGPDGTVYVAFSVWDNSYNNPAINPSPKSAGRYTYGGVLRCIDGTAKATEWEVMHDGLGLWDGIWLNRAVPGSTHLISLAWDWKEWRFKLDFWDDTLSGAGPAPVSPLANAQGMGSLVADTSVNVPLSWQAKGGASLYQWQVSEDSAFIAANNKSGTTSDLTVTVLDLKPATTYYWRSRAAEPMLSRWNTAQQFTTIIGGTSGAPQLITPAIGATITDDTPLFTWGVISSASNHEIQVAISQTFAAADIVIDEQLGNVQAYEATTKLDNGTYYWQVKGTNATTNTETPWSALGSFTLDTAAGFSTPTPTTISNDIWRENIRSGDILLDPTGAGGLGHVGIYYETDNFKYVVEALPSGVERTPIEDWDDGGKANRGGAYILRVNCPAEVADAAASLAYNISLRDTSYTYFYITKSSSLSQSKWYCSELVWAVYINEGIDIEDTPDDLGVSPMEIYFSKNTQVIGHRGYTWLDSPPGPLRIIAFGTGLIWIAYCPVDLVVTDPDGLTVSRDSIEMPDAVYMIDDFNNDGSPDTLVSVAEGMVGTYNTTVVPQDGAQPTDTYTLNSYQATGMTILANNVSIADIPVAPYAVSFSYESTPTPTAQPTSTPTPTHTPSQTGKGGTNWILIGGVVGGVILLLAVIIVITIKSRGGKIAERNRKPKYRQGNKPRKSQDDWQDF